MDITDPTMEKLRKAMKHHNDVGFLILKRLLDKEGDGKNIVFSPLSIYMMLTLLAAGSSKNTQLRHHLLSFLKFKSIGELNSSLSKLFPFLFGDSSDGGGPCLTSANGVWAADDLTIKPSFEKLLETLYSGKLNHVDFINKSGEVVKEANAWIKKETRGLISEIFDDSSIDGSTRMILANTVYFDAQWSSKFHEILTKRRDFHLLNGSSIKVPFMSSSAKRAISVFDDFKVASLSYETQYRSDDRCLSMLIFLPNDRNGLSSLMERAFSESGFLDRHRPRSSVSVDKFRIPKFKLEFDFEPRRILEEVGLGSLFSVGSGFSKMVKDPAGKDLYVSKMIHKAVISVDEERTVAAAMSVCHTKVGCCMNMEPPVKINFVADHPFLYLIEEEVSGTVLFVGQMLNPSGNSIRKHESPA